MELLKVALPRPPLPPSKRRTSCSWSSNSQISSPDSISLTSVPIGTLRIQVSPPFPFWSLPRPGSPFLAFQCFLK